MATLIFLIALMIMLLVKLIIQGTLLLHRLQQLGYSNLKLVKWLEGNQYRGILLWNILELIGPLLIIWILFTHINGLPMYKYITAFIMLVVFIWKLFHPFIAGWVGPKAIVKKPLKYTARVKRLLITEVIVIVLLLIFTFKFTATPFEDFSLSKDSFFKFNAFLLFISVVTPVVIFISNFINYPIEHLIKLIYFTKARRKLAKTDIIKIAITGSYGKTSTKFFLSTILSVKYKTLHTPASYNTPMGISKVINSTDLSQYDIFVIEMGADKKGDIKTLCKLVNPDYGIVTAIGNQHLATFGNLQNIIDTKLSLFEYMQSSGFGIYNYDSPVLQENINPEQYNFPLYSYSIQENDIDSVSLFSNSIALINDKQEFCVNWDENTKKKFKVDLLGRHNVSNLTGCILFCTKYGMSINEIALGVEKIQPVEHRLQKIISPNGITILDDAFNANIEGAKEALVVLKNMSGNKKIIVTPGLIELGEEEEVNNSEFGREIAKSVDYVILIGEMKTKSILNGILNEGFEQERIFVVNSLDESKNILAKIVEIGSVVLFENDLPDTFNE